MNGQEVRQELRNSVLEMVSEDFLGLGEIPALLTVLYPKLDSHQRKVVTLEVIADLLKNQMIRAGHLDSSGGRFISNDSTWEHLVESMDNEWSALGRDPHIGEIAWFDAVD